MVKISASLQPACTDDFLKYLIREGWTNLERDVKIYESRVDLIATSPVNLVHGFKFISRWDDISEEQMKESWKKGVESTLNYVFRSDTLEHSEQIERWIIVSIGCSSKIVLPDEKLTKYGFGFWIFYPMEIKQFYSEKTTKVNRNMIAHGYWSSTISLDIQDFKEEDKIPIETATEIVDKYYKEGKDEGKEETLMEFRSDFKSALYNDFLAGGLFAGGVFVLIDGILQTIEMGTYWYVILIGISIMLVSAIPWIFRFVKTFKK